MLNLVCLDVLSEEVVDQGQLELALDRSLSKLPFDNFECFEITIEIPIFPVDAFEAAV